MNKDINNIQKSVFIQENVGDFFLNKISNDIFLKFLLLLTLFSYYYNLPVLKYSLIGNNEFRLYDITGLMIIYYSYIYYKFIFFVIRQVKVFNWMRMLLNWVIFTLPITLFFFI